MTLRNLTRKYVPGVAAAVAVTLIGVPAVAAAQQHHRGRAHQKRDFIMLRGRRASRTVLFVQHRAHVSTVARAASCLAGKTTDPNYCTPPVEQSLFGAFTENPFNASTTFGSNSSSTCKSLGYTAPPCGVYTTAANELIVAFVAADGPSSGGQSLTVTCTTASGGACPVTFHKVASENAGLGDSEVWYADAATPISKSAPIFVTATASKSSCGLFFRCDVSLQAVTFTNAITLGAGGAQAIGIGASNVCASSKGAPSCSLTTTESDSQVWAELNNWGSATIPTWPSGQFAIGVSDPSSRKTFYTQFAGTCNGSCSVQQLPGPGLYQNPYAITPMSFSAASTKVTINDTAPTNNPFNEVVVEIL